MIWIIPWCRYFFNSLSIYGSITAFAISAPRASSFWQAMQYPHISFRLKKSVTAALSASSESSHGLCH